MTLDAATEPIAHPVRVWDLPTRLFHWLLLLAVVGAVVTAKVGGNAMPWHFRCGYAVLTLLVFRVIWGFVGGRWSRFTQFVRGPGAILAYLRGRSEAAAVGHNPLGALSVLGLLGILLAQAATGLVADDEIANTGPLIRFVSGATSSLATGWHKGWGQGLLLGLVGLHVLAIVVYALRGQRLVGPMITGDRLAPAGVPGSTDTLASRLLAGLLLAACAGAVGWVVSLGA